MTTKIATIIDSIKTLTLIEAAELVKAMEETFGVSAAAPVAVAGGAAPAGAAAAEPEKEAFRVELVEAGANKINVIKALREVATLMGVTLGLKEAKDLVEGAPGVAFESVPKEHAPKVKAKLEEAGAKVKLS